MANELAQLSPEDKEIRKELCWRTIDNLHATILSNYENYDRALLTLASGILGGSVTFLNLLFPLSKADYLPIFYLALASLIFTVGIILCLYFPSIDLLKTMKDDAIKYYLKNDQSAIADTKIRAKKIETWSKISGSSFFIGFVLLLIFIGLNTFMKPSVEETLKPGIHVEQMTGAPEISRIEYQE